jgi:hypothetical protein
MYKGYFYDLSGHEINKIEPICLMSNLESSIVEVSLTLGFEMILMSKGNDFALFEVNSKMRLLISNGHIKD